MSKIKETEIDYEEIERRIEVKELTNEIDTPDGIVSFLEKRNGIHNFDFRNPDFLCFALTLCKNIIFFRALAMPVDK